jgi:hypothetical protein
MVNATITATTIKLATEELSLRCSKYISNSGSYGYRLGEGLERDFIRFAVAVVVTRWRCL